MQAVIQHLLAIAFVDMPEDVEFEREPFQLPGQIVTAYRQRLVHLIEDACWRTMGDKNVSV